MIPFKEKFQEVYQSLQDKMRNPFLLTFCVVWIIHNWILVYTIFTFDPNTSQDEQLYVIKDYIKQQGGWKGMVFPSLWWTLASMAVFYGFNILSENLLTLYYIIKSFISRLFNDKRNYKTIEEYKYEESKAKRLQNRVEELEKQKREISSNIEDKEKESEELKDFNNGLRQSLAERDQSAIKEKGQYDLKIEKLNTDKSHLESNIEKLNGEIAKLDKVEEQLGFLKIKHDSFKSYIQSNHIDVFNRYIFAEAFDRIKFEGGKAYFHYKQDVEDIFKNNFQVITNFNGLDYTDNWVYSEDKTFYVSSDDRDNIGTITLESVSISDSEVKLTFHNEKEEKDFGYILEYVHNKFIGRDDRNNEIEINLEI